MNARFIDNGDDTITDNKTGLMWEKKTEENVNAVHTWEKAQSVHVARLNELCFGGHEEWRLPTIQELVGIVDYTHLNPSIDPIFGPTASDWYWSSTTFAGIPDSAWGVYFYGGYVDDDYKGFDLHVRAVRGG